MNYGMFTIEGNLKVASIVEYARFYNLSWETVEQNLIDLGNYDSKYYEAVIPTVKDNVYNAIYNR
jgi:hypothetical protein